MSVEGPTLFLHNEANDGGALHAIGTAIEVKDRMNFTHNSAANGGAVFLAESVSINLSAQDCSHPMISSSFNSAKRRGGLIYHEDSVTNEQCDYHGTDDISTTNGQTLPYCFLQIATNTSSLFHNCSLINSHDDSAGIEASVLYGGMLDS